VVVLLVVLLLVEALLRPLLGLGEVPQLPCVPVGEASTAGRGEVVTAFLRRLDADLRRGYAGLHLLLYVARRLGHGCLTPR
jgi:hypothetical protein